MKVVEMYLFEVDYDTAVSAVIVRKKYYGSAESAFRNAGNGNWDKEINSIEFRENVYVCLEGC